MVGYRGPMPRVRVEFTVEPFVDGELGPHVTAAIDAVRAAGLDPEVGPFSTAAEGESESVAEALRDLVTAAFAAGATQVSMQVHEAGG